MSADMSKEALFSQKYREYSGKLYRLSLLYLGNAQDAEEAVQDAFIRLLYKAPNFPDKQSETRWLIQVQINICKDLLRTRQKQRQDMVSLSDVEMEGAVQPEDRMVLDRLLALPPKYKSVIYLYYYEGYKIEEISKLLKMGSSSVKMRLKRGKELLRMELEAETDE